MPSGFDDATPGNAANLPLVIAAVVILVVVVVLVVRSRRARPGSRRSGSDTAPDDGGQLDDGFGGQ